MLLSGYQSYRRNGLQPTIFKSYDILRAELYEKFISLDPIDELCFNQSIRELNKVQESEKDIDKILSVIGYDVFDFDVLDMDEYRNCNTPYVGKGNYPGKYKGRGHYKELKPLQEYEAIRGLAEAVKEENPRTVVEIGTHTGGTFYIWSRYLENSENLLSVDINYPGRRVEFIQQFAPDKNITCVQGDAHSQKTFKKVEKELNNTIDFLYIDLPHSYNAFKQAFQKYKPLLDENAIVGFHDISHPGSNCPKLWSELQNEYETKELGRPPQSNGLLWI
jgi:predicted O-methyltransferase YrrM